VGGTDGTSALSLWLDAGTITGISDGADITTWEDQSGNGYDAAVGTAAPSYSATGGGNVQPALTFDNANSENLFVTDLPTDYVISRKITIDNTKVVGTADHTDFPVLISFTDADLRTIANGGNVYNTNGYDIVFTASDGTTLLDFDLEKYVATTGEYIVWVRIPTLDYDDDTDIYIHYGNASVTTDQSSTGVWDTNYQGVWHLEERPVN